MKRMFYNASIAAFFVGLLVELFRWIVDWDYRYEGLIGVVAITTAVFLARNFMTPN